MAEGSLSRFQAWRARSIAGIGGAAALLTSWGIGLFEVRNPPAVPAFTAGKAVAAGEWRVRLDRVQLAAVAPDGGHSAGRIGLLVTAEILNLGGRSSGSFGQAVRLATPIAGADKVPTVYLSRDRERLGQLHPGLAEGVTFMWTIPANAVPPKTLRFEIVEREFKARDNLYAAAGWFNPHVIGTIDLPLNTSPQMGAVR